MQEGSLVVALTSFDEVKREWPALPFPNKGDILTICDIRPHPNAEIRALGIVLLFFDELEGSPGICDKTVEGEWNFAEIQPPMEINIEELTEIEVLELCTV